MDNDHDQPLDEPDFKHPSRKPKKGQQDTSNGAKVLTLFEQRLELKEKPIACVGPKWYRYRNGCSRPIERETFNQLAWAVQSPDSANSRKTKELLSAIEQKYGIGEGGKMCHCAMRLDLEYPEKYYLINCGNQVVRVSRESGTVSLLPWHPDYRFTTQLAGCFRPELIALWEHSLFYEKLCEVLPDKADRHLLLDMFASSLWYDNRFEVVLFCIGNGLNGKGMLINTLCHAFGGETISSLTIKQICGQDNGKHLFELEHKLLNVATELSDEIIPDSQVLKSIASREKIRISRMYQNGIDIEPRCVGVFLTNNPPRLRNGTNGDCRRMRYIVFDQDCSRAKNANDKIMERLQEERDLILTYLISRLARLATLPEMSRGGEVSEAELRTFVARNNMVGEFVREALDWPVEQSLTRDDIWLGYQRYASLHEVKVSSKEKFFRQLYQRYPEMKKFNTQLRQNGRRRYVLRGVGWTELGRNLRQEAL
jgi:P4 family phage/plasmid primase-like protien